MARPLSKHTRKTGNLYIRPTNIEAAIDAALAQNLTTLCSWAAVQDSHSPEYLPSECLVHLIREARRRDDEATMNALLPPLLERCKGILLHNVSDEIPNAAFLRDEILGQFAELFANDGHDENHDELDFFEVRFNSAFMTLRFDILREETKAYTRHILLPDTQESEPIGDGEYFVSLSEKLLIPATQESSLALKTLIKAIKSLPPDELNAVVLRVMGYEEESEDPNKTTVATLCGVTGRTIRNRLNRATKKLLPFKEDLW